MTRFSARYGTALLVLACAFVLGGCSPQDSSVSPAEAGDSELLTQMLEVGFAKAQSEFQREVLQKVKETGELSEADWKEANSRYKSCLIEQGFVDVEIRYLGNRVQIESTTPEEESAADAETRREKSLECYEKTSAFINEIYEYLNSGDGGAQAGRGTGAGIEQAVLACLQGRGLVPESVTLDEFVADLESNDGAQFSPQGQNNELEEQFAQCWIEAST